MRSAFATLIFSAGALATFSCRPANVPAGMECNDPKIDPKVDRLLVGNDGRTYELTRQNRNYLTSADEAKAFLANASEPMAMVARDPSGPSLQERVDDFLAKTDFTKEKLTFTSIDIDGDEGFVGQIATPGRVELVFHSCSAMGGARPPHVAFTAIYRIPRDAVVSQEQCGSCPQVECCPP